MIAFIALFFPALIMIFWKHILCNEDSNWKNILPEYAFSVVLINLIAISILYFIFGSSGSLTEKLNSYLNFAGKYMFLSSVIAFVIPLLWVKCRPFCLLSKVEDDPATIILKTDSSRELYLDLIRALSMLLVIFNHTGVKGFMLYSVATKSPLYPFYMFLSVACKTAVPLYWMVSGALLLPKEESIGRVYRHRVLRMVIVLMLFSFIHYGWQLLYGQVESFDIKYYFTKLYTSQFSTAYWFIYSYISMLMMLPLLRIMVKGMSRQHFIYLFVIIITMRGIIPILQYLVGQGELNMNSQLTGNLFSVNILHFIGGYYFADLLKKEEIISKKMIGWLIAGLIAIILTCIMTQYKINITGQSDGGYAETFYNNLVSIPTFALFYAARYICINYHPVKWLAKVIKVCGKASFGIMLLEEALRTQLSFIYSNLLPILHSLPACLIWILSVYLCGLLITLCLKKIPYIKRLI